MEKVCVVCGGAQKRIFYYRAHHYHRCIACGLVSTYPVPDSAALRRHYAEKFRDGNYRLLRDYSERYLLVYEGFVGVLRRRLRSSGRNLRGLRVLDIGCFTGEFLRLLQERGADVCGLELQPEAVAVAAIRLPGRVLRADVLAADLGEARYDVVTLLGVIEHVVDPMALLRRSATLLRPGGILMLQTPNSASMLARTLGRLWPPYAPVEHIHLFSRRSLASALRTAGFVDIVSMPHWKRLPIAYVYEMFRTFGPEFHAWFAPLYRCLPQALVRKALPFYGGEILLTARKV